MWQFILNNNVECSPRMMIYLFSLYFSFCLRIYHKNEMETYYREKKCFVNIFLNKRKTKNFFRFIFSSFFLFNSQKCYFFPNFNLKTEYLYFWTTFRLYLSHYMSIIRLHSSTLIILFY